MRLVSALQAIQTKTLRALIAVCALTACATLVLTPSSPAFAQGQLTHVTVEILNTQYFGCSDDIFSGPPDIYFNVTFDGTLKTTLPTELESNLSPFAVDLQLEHDVDYSKGTISIIIEQKDRDSGANAPDDFCDLDGANPDHTLDLTLDLRSCQITGDLSGSCGETISTSSSGDPRFGFQFKVNVIESPRTPGLNVRCMHHPLWPQPGEKVTIRAEALDGLAEPISSQPVTNIEIYVDDSNNPLVATVTDGPFGAPQVSVDYTPMGASQFFYGCRVVDRVGAEDVAVHTGWRVVQIGTPTHGRAVPVLYTGPRANRLDIVFIAVHPDYDGPDNPEFLDDVTKAISDGYFAGNATYRAAGRLFLENQDAFNFWIALDPGTAFGFGCGELPPTVHPPANWNTDYTFANAGVLLHRQGSDFRDCSEVGQRIFTTNLRHVLGERKRIGTLLHETGHMPFGLADEYCLAIDGRCTGGYSLANPHPNVYFSEGSCLGDDLADIAADTCLDIQESGVRSGWYRLDPDSTISDDLMKGSGNLMPRGADVRRINWLFERCRSAGCIRNR